MEKPPELAECSPSGQQAYACLLKLASGKRIRTTKLMADLGSKLALDQVEVKGVVRELFRANLLLYTPDRQDLPADGLVEIVRPQKAVGPTEEMWLQALQQSSLSPDARVALMPLHAKLVDLTGPDLVTLVGCLEALSSAGQTVLDDAGFNVSARSIMGGSKVLSGLDLKAMQALGLPARLKISSPRYVVCAGPSNPVATLLIENPRAFENAVCSGLGKSVALVCTYGFGLSYLGQAWIQEIHSEDKPIQIIRDGAPGTLSQLLQAESVYLWADLDVAALGIYKSLKSAIPRLQFSAIYRVMVEMAKDPKQSHPYASIFEKDGQVTSPSSMIETSDPIVNLLFESCKFRAVDQEAVGEGDILLYGARSLR
ncbi:Uncharacterised protein [Comamonas aquatica]|uniref:hypothetical protein n=1 Tax=Comamonas aquatica TaxID=225991 RepID=UPI001EF2F8E9|nr:hypothetical protein [Comamonas aquatica]CAB5681887.1 Uncharacterised protein [Comamonas aquatica]CAC9217280.1 Uncharacterised protein [Comamonas aquatica]